MISEEKTQIVINNYFKSECSVDTSIRQAFEKGFRIGLKKGLSAQPESHWIPCSDRLPELDQEVLVYAIGKVDGFGDSVIAMSKRHIFRLFSSSEGVEGWTSPWPYFVSNYEITHWMPLPDPPKGERE